MTISIRKSHSGKATEFEFGDLTAYFSYETLVGFAIPGLGRVRAKNIWGSTTGKHINSWRAKYTEVDLEAFEEASQIFDKHLSGEINRDGAISALKKLLEKQHTRW